MTALAIAADARIAIVGTAIGSVVICDLVVGRKVGDLLLQGSRINDLCALNRDDLVASGGDDHSLRVWSWNQAKELACFYGDSPITALAYAAEQQILVAGEASGRVHFFRLKDM
jgi:WD40 repeat protein